MEAKKDSKLKLITFGMFAVLALGAVGGYQYSESTHTCAEHEDCSEIHVIDVFDCGFCRDARKVPVIGFDGNVMIVKMIDCTECAR